ncbi:MAG: adenylate kinase family protein [Clostridia bacterium]|jgi:adenylate kinase
MYIVLLGPPGSGKGTQGAILSRKLGLSHLSTGDLFRGIFDQPDHPLYKDVAVMKEGKLVSDEVVNKVVQHALEEPEHASGVIFDGYPRTIAQAKSLDSYLADRGKKVDFTLNFKVTREVLLHRLLGRRVCPKCRKVFHIRQGLQECDECRVPLVQREDDREEVILKRFEEYRNQTAPLEAYYAREGFLINLQITDPDTEPEDVQHEIMSILSQYRFIDPLDHKWD